MSTTDSVRLATVTELWRYPVKSMRGERCDVLNVSMQRCEGDHLFGVLDETSGMVMSAKRHGQLLLARARYDAAGAVWVELPDGTRHEAGSAGCDRAMSDWLDRPVRVIEPEDGVTYEFEINEPDQLDSDPAWFTFPSAPGSLFDGRSSIHAVLTSGLGAAHALAPDSSWAVSRFRPQFVLDDLPFVVTAGSAGAAGPTNTAGPTSTASTDSTAGAAGSGGTAGPAGPTSTASNSGAAGLDVGFLEAAWPGRDVRVGAEVVCTVRKRTERCVLTTRPQGPPDGESHELGRDRDVLRTLSTHTDSLFGLYFDPTAGGAVRIGDPVTVETA